jgi:hypothetical protein
MVAQLLARPVSLSFTEGKLCRIQVKREYLTHPFEKAGNNGCDNTNHDLIVAKGDFIYNEEQRRTCGPCLCYIFSLLDAIIHHSLWWHVSGDLCPHGPPGHLNEEVDHDKASARVHIQAIFSAFHASHHLPGQVQIMVDCL